MRVAVDATPLLLEPTGIGAFAHSLLSGLAERADVDASAFALSWRGRGALAEKVPAGVEVIDRPLPAQPLRQSWLRFDHPRLDRLIGPHDLVHGTNFVVPPSRGAQVVTVHDLTPVRFPELCTKDTLQYPALIERAIRRGAWVHTVTDHVRAEVIQHFRIDPSRVVTVANAVTPITGGEGSSGQAIVGAERYVLALGTVEPRKDLPLLVRAFDAVATDHPDLHLVHAGPDGWGADALSDVIDASPHRDRIRRLGFVSDAQRAHLLAGAALFAYPSTYEGFGMPPLEAMSVGTPAVTTDAGGLLEVAGGGAEQVPVGDTEAFAAAMARVLDDDDHRSALIERGHQNAAQFTVERLVVGMVDLYRRALASE